jgi:iron complex outermembrane receptor protein
MAAVAQQTEPTELDPLVVTGQKPKPGKKKSVAKKAPAKAPAAAATPAPGAPSANGPTTASATGAVNGYVATATTTGTKAPTDITEIPQFVSLVGRTEIDDQGAQKVDEALRYTSGVFAQPFGSDTDTNWLFIRGFQATQTGIFQDGLPLYSHGFGAFYIDSFGLERIEVLKGPASVLYGGSNPGGIVNYVSKHPDGERVRYLEGGITDTGFAYLGFDIGDRAAPGFDYRVTGRIAGGDGYYDFQDDGFRGFISPTIRWSDDRTSFTLLANYSNIDETHGAASFLPYVGTVVRAPFGYIPRESNYTEPDLDTYEREQGSIGYEFEHKFSPDLIVRQNVRYGAADVYEHNLYPNGYVGGDAASGMLDRVNFEHDTTISSFLIDNQVEWKTGDRFVEHTVLAGLDYKYFNIDQVQGSALFGTTTPISVVNPVYGVPQTVPVSYLNQDLTQEQIGAYVQDQIRFGGGWIVTLNGRYDWVWTEAKDGPNYYSAPDFHNTTTSEDGEASGRAGIAYTFKNGLTPYASAATYFNPVIGTTAEGDLFKPETGQQYEVGVKYAPRFLDTIVTASLFDITRQNVLTTNPANIFAQIQTGEVTSKGFEIEAKANITESLRVTAAFTALDLEITKDTNAAIVGNQPFVVPEIMASASFDYTFRGNAFDGISIGAGVRYYGESYADQENTLKVPDVTLFDAKIGYEWQNWGIDLNVTNLFDEKYVASCQGVSVCSYGEARTVKLKTHVTW